MAECLQILAAVAVAEEDGYRAAQLCGADEAIREALHITRPPAQHMTAPHAQTLASLRDQLTETAWHQGWGMCLDAIARFALSCEQTSYP